MNLYIIMLIYLTIGLVIATTFAVTTHLALKSHNEVYSDETPQERADRVLATADIRNTLNGMPARHGAPGALLIICILVTLLWPLLIPLVILARR